jgi:hypothetical protein
LPVFVKIRFYLKKTIGTLASGDDRHCKNLNHVQGVDNVMSSTVSNRVLYALIACVFLLAAKNADAQIVWADSFTNNVATSSQQLNDWLAFKAQLVPGNQYFSMQTSGSLDAVGISCNDPARAAEFANLLYTNTSGIVSCDGHQWSLCANRYDGEVWIDPPGLCSGANCPDPGYIIRPGIGNDNWGGIGTATCDAPSQTMSLAFNGEIGPSVPVPALSTWGLILLVMLLGLGLFLRHRRTA